MLAGALAVLVYSNIETLHAKPLYDDAGTIINNPVVGRIQAVTGTMSMVVRVCRATLTRWYSNMSSPKR